MCDGSGVGICDSSGFGADSLQQAIKKIVTMHHSTFSPHHHFSGNALHKGLVRVRSEFMGKKKVY